jgi:catechol 2,3-dioxygenase-like lactoylglutathione lyase family enzyme
MEQSAGPEWAKRFFAVTPVVDDLPTARQWYIDVFGMPIVDESDSHCTFRFPDNVFINLNVRQGVAELVEPAPVGPPGTPARMMLTLIVTDVDEVVARLRGMGIEPLQGPTDRPWGSRTATIADPSGNCWELSS